MRLLITGAGGFVGKHVLAAADVHDVVAVEHRWSGADEVDERVRSARPEGCIHLGWYADPADYLTAVEPNAASVMDTLDLARSLEAAGCGRLVVAGSSAEYAPADHPLDEDDLVAPTTVYGSAKAMTHSLLQTRHRPQGMTVAWARLFNVIGPGEDARRVIPSAARSLLDGREMRLSPGTQVRDYVDVRDVAAALVSLVLVEAAGAFNVSTGREVPLREMLEAIAAECGNERLLRFGELPFRANENMYLVGRNDRLHKATGWAPEHGTREMARGIVQSLREGGS
jgi:nucleoside-diphosphate-sugar epimerase